LNTHYFHISLYDIAFFGAIFVGSAFAALLQSSKNINQIPNRFLGLALAVIVARLLWILGADIHLEIYLPYWNQLPLRFSLALGPLVYFYVLKITRPEYRFGLKGLLHFSPVLVEVACTVLGINQSVLQPLAFISVAGYMYLSHRQIEHFYRGLKFNEDGDRYRHELRWLHRLLAIFGLLWLLWIPFTAVDYFGYHYQLGLQVYYPLYIVLSVAIIWIGVVAFLRPGFGAHAGIPPVIKTSMSAELRKKGAWLKKAMEAGLFYRDPDLGLSSLAEKLGINPHELSRIINIALKKNFNDFVNEYRVRDVVNKMQDAAFDHITLLGIAFECGFNSKTTFNRTFKQVTGKSPVEYKNELKKERPDYNLERRARFAALNSSQEVTPVWSSEKFKRNYMIKNYFKIAWRYMLHNKVYSALNIAGLATGMAVALLIGLWVYSQYSYDTFLPGYDQLYQVKLNFFHSGEVVTQTGSAMPLVNELKKYPEVRYASERGWAGSHSLVVGDKKLRASGSAIGSDFLRMFPYPLVKGNVNSVFADPNSIILTEFVAKALFGNQDPINKVIRIDNQYNIKVTGLMKDAPLNSTLQFQFFLPYSFIEATDPGAKKERTNWQSYSTPEYVELQSGADAEAFKNKIKDIVWNHAQDKSTKIGVFLQPAKNWHLLTQFKDGKPVDGVIEYVRMFGIIGILVLVIACINFVNLSTARAEKRAREVGVRKSVGSLRRDLIFQFLSESLLVTLIAFAVSILIVQLVLPSFNTLTFGAISIPYTNGTFWCIMVAYVLVTGLLAGSRPAFYLSSFKPVKVLKGTVQLGKRASLPRKIMVAVQFTCSIALIISTLIIYQQLQYARDRPKGYNVNNLVYVNDSPDLEKNYMAFKQDLLESGQVESVAKGGSAMLFFPASFGILDFPGKKTGESLEMATTAVSPDFFKTVGMTFVAGHDFVGGVVPDTLHIIINEAAAQRLRLKNPVDKIITTEYTKNPLRIIGVVKNAIVGSPFYSATPALYVYNPGWGGAIMFRISRNAGTQAALKKIGAIFDKYNPTFPFEYSFADQAYDQQYQLESLVGTLASIFAGLAIFISCLGLFGLSAYVAEQRKKEIGIRKVLGASVPQVWTLLSGDFLKLVGISCVIASPIAFYFLYHWLQKYDYRIAIGPWAFLIAAAVTLVITIVTISYQAISSALTNPVKSLRTE
jgi:ABC-type antimicrobial peptide transport system permease subunit/AraC-like DNA-binding protein